MPARRVLLCTAMAIATIAKIATTLRPPPWKKGGKGPDSVHADHQRYPGRLSRLFRPARPRCRAVEPLGAAQRPDIAVHQCRHGPVQERLHRRREAALSARCHLAEMRAG